MTTRRDIKTKLVFETETIAASGTAYSEVIDLNDYKPVGYFSIQVELTGAGTAQLTYELSNDGLTYLTPSTAVDIVTAHTVASGPGSDGKDIYSFAPELAKYLKITATETSTTDPVVLSAMLAIQ